VCCTRLAPISDISEVQLQCGFSLFGSRFSGDVHCGGNTVVANATQNATQLRKNGPQHLRKMRRNVFPGLHGACVAHVLRQILTYRKWNCSAVLVSYEAASLEMYTVVAT